MGCNTDYMAAKANEIQLSRVACLLDELDTGCAINKSHWSGYHPLVYSQNFNADAMVSELCEKLQSTDVSKCSLEMQMWWRDHVEADKQRANNEVAKAKTDEEKQAAIAKLTPHERKILGL